MVFVLGSALIASTTATAAEPQAYVAITFTGMSPSSPGAIHCSPKRRKMSATSSVARGMTRLFQWTVFP